MFWNIFIHQSMPELLWPIWHICNWTLYNFSSSSFLFGFSVSAGSCDRSPCTSTLILSLTSFCCWIFHGSHSILRWRCRRSRWRWTRRTCHSSLCCNWFSCNCWWVVVSDHWSNGKYTHDLRRIFWVRELPVYLQEALLSLINQILGRTPLLLLALRRWQLPPSSDFSISSRFPTRQS